MDLKYRDSSKIRVKASKAQYLMIEKERSVPGVFKSIVIYPVLSVIMKEKQEFYQESKLKKKTEMEVIWMNNN